MTEKELIRMARKARENAYCPYSGFAVGAVLLTKEGEVYTGCNVENAAYSPSLCAERSAFAAAVAHGERDFEAIAVVGGKETPCSPCGVCRQVMAEFCSPDFKVICATPQEDGPYLVKTLSELLPLAFDSGSL